MLIFAVFRMRICTSVTDHEVARAKNLLKTNILMQLDGMFCCFFFLNEEETKYLKNAFSIITTHSCLTLFTQW